MIKAEPCHRPISYASLCQKQNLGKRRQRNIWTFQCCEYNSALNGKPKVFFLSKRPDFSRSQTQVIFYEITAMPRVGAIVEKDEFFLYRVYFYYSKLVKKERLPAN